MAADKTLVQGAYQAAMANKTSDYTKMFAMQGAQIANIAGQAMKSYAANQLKAKAAKVDKEFNKVFNGTVGNIAILNMERQGELAKRVSVQAANSYNSSDPVGKATTMANLKNLTEQQTGLANILQGVTTGEVKEGTKLVDVEVQYGSPKAKEYITSIGSGDYTADYKEGELMFTFTNGDKINYSELQELIQLKDPKETEATMSNLKKNIMDNAASGNSYETTVNTNQIVKKIIPDGSSLFNFTTQSNFTNANGEPVNFGQAIQSDVQIRNSIVDLVENDPKFKRFDVTPEDEVTQDDLNALLKDLKSEAIEENTADLIDVITNPQNESFDLKTSQKIVSDALNQSLSNSAHKLGVKKYDDKDKASANINESVEKAFYPNSDGTIDSPTWNLLTMRTEKVKFVDGEFDEYVNSNGETVPAGTNSDQYISLIWQDGKWVEKDRVSKNISIENQAEMFKKILGSKSSSRQTDGFNTMHGNGYQSPYDNY